MPNELMSDRSKFLRALYDETKGIEFETVPLADLKTKLPFTADEIEKIMQHLINEKLIERNLNGEVSITHLGIKQVELAM